MRRLYPILPGRGGRSSGKSSTDRSKQADDHRGQNGQRFTYYCPPGGSGEKSLEAEFTPTIPPSVRQRFTPG